ncbi:uncharacterized protein LOC135939136 [Cloeon dipterum]|uniref:uncharacterized protein LOC135939136 n=1 Tax=Cloeon dipterum TaxID=197152 RepID=UPI00321F7F71
MKILTLTLALVLAVISETVQDDEGKAVRAVVKLPTKCKETKYKEMCKFYKKIVPIYENVEIWRLEDQKPMVTFYGDRDQVVDDVPIWILPKDEWEVVFLDNGLNVRKEFRQSHQPPANAGQCGAEAPVTVPKAKKEAGKKGQSKKEKTEL